MKQRINLYNPHEPKQAFDPLSYRGSLAIAATVAAVFLLLGLGLSFYAGYQQSHVAELSKEKKNIEAAVMAEQARFAHTEVNTEILAEQKRLQNEIASRQQLKNLLYRIQPSQGASFSSYLYALAEASLPESWLIEFQLDNTQHSFIALGAAVDAPAVPVLLETVSATEAFQGMSVSELDLESSESGVLFKVTAELRAYE